MSVNQGAQMTRPEWSRTKGVDWQSRAACRDNPQAEYAFFYAPAKVRNQAINTFCHDACPVREDCELFGVESMSEGVWGGKYRTMADAQAENNRMSSIRDHDRDRTRDIVVKKYQSGVSMRQIARDMRRGDAAIRTLISESGITLRGRHGS